MNIKPRQMTAAAAARCRHRVRSPNTAIDITVANAMPALV